MKVRLSYSLKLRISKKWRNEYYIIVERRFLSGVWWNGRSFHRKFRSLSSCMRSPFADCVAAMFKTSDWYADRLFRRNICDGGSDTVDIASKDCWVDVYMNPCIFGQLHVFILSVLSWSVRSLMKLNFDCVKTAWYKRTVQEAFIQAAERNNWTTDYICDDRIVVHTNPSMWTFTNGE